ncbi:MAG TPA: hypothetical protein VJ962_01600, partial [Clostridia bacterium]|nr:hypothetical protein [Clostridia bacterium]
LDFYSDQDIRTFKEVKEEVKDHNLKLDETRVRWDVENHKIVYPNKEVNKIFKDVYIELKH